MDFTAEQVEVFLVKEISPNPEMEVSKYSKAWLPDGPPGDRL